MSYKIAIASTDGIYVDAHFGGASSFLIYEVNGDGSYENKEVRIVSGTSGDRSSDSIIPSGETENSCGSGSDCTNKSNCTSNANSCQRSSYASPNENESVRESGGGCGGHSDSKIEANVALIADCRCLLCYKVGAGAERQLERKAITAFQVNYKIKDALEKIINYYIKIDNHISLRNAR